MRALPAFGVNGAALASLALAAALGGSLVLGAGRWGSYPPELARIAGFVFYPDKSHPCFVGARTPGRWMSYDPAVCLAADPLRPTLLGRGDSHAEHLVPEIGEGRPEFNLQFAGATGCTPTVDVEGDW
jgi:hypothetical protein